MRKLIRRWQYDNPDSGAFDHSRATRDYARPAAATDALLILAILARCHGFDALGFVSVPALRHLPPAPPALRISLRPLRRDGRTEVGRAPDNRPGHLAAHVGDIRRLRADVQWH